jgi:hypothetical protein
MGAGCELQWQERDATGDQRFHTQHADMFIFLSEIGKRKKCPIFFSIKEI